MGKRWRKGVDGLGRESALQGRDDRASRAGICTDSSTYCATRCNANTCCAETVEVKEVRGEELRLSFLFWRHEK